MLRKVLALLTASTWRVYPLRLAKGLTLPLTSTMGWRIVSAPNLRYALAKSSHSRMPE